MTKEYAIIPKPNKLEPKAGYFSLTRNTRILADSDCQQVSAYLISLLNLSLDQLHLEIPGSSSAEDSISLALDPALGSLGDEGYFLQVDTDQISIRANTPAGIFYAIQALFQLMPLNTEDKKIPCVTIEDSPRFPWRGIMLDTSRHMFSVEEIKQLLDQMALHKFNRFHWHITDDQGWRIEIKKYPKLTEISSQRKSSPVLGRRKRSDETPYGGFYTQEEVKEIVQYAANQHITVVPEIDMPGHSIAVLAAYPELSCTGGPYEVRTKWGIEQEVYCAGNEKVYAFLEDVLDEVLNLFPSKEIHIGGDEVPKDRWKECPQCQQKIETEGLANEEELQSYFIRRMGEYLKNKDRKLIGWDEILEGGLDADAIVMSWRGMKGGIEAANLGNDVIMTPNTHCYLDYRQQKNRHLEPPAIRATLLLEDAYVFEPVPEEIATGRQDNILGIQGNIWTEYINTFDHLQYMAWPRGCALAEVGWSGPEREYDDFLRRLKPHLHRIKKLGINFRDPFLVKE